jgi:hypothetical protein
MSESTNREEIRKGAARGLLATGSCIMGILLGAGGIVFALLGGGASISAGAVGAALGILGYFLGERRLGAVAIVLGILAIFAMAAADTGLIPWVTPAGHGYD